MIININALERVIEINIEKYYPVHSYIKLECPKDKPKYIILCMNQQVMTVEEYIELRRQTANIEINEYLIITSDWIKICLICSAYPFNRP